MGPRSEEEEGEDEVMWETPNLDAQTLWGSCLPTFKCHKQGSERAGLGTWFESLSQGHFPDLAFGLLSRIGFVCWEPTLSLQCLQNLQPV